LENSAKAQKTPPDDARRFQILIGAVIDYAIYMLDPNGFVTSWNPGAQRFKGYEAGEILGQHFSLFYTEEDRRAGLPELALETSAREGRFESEGWRVRKDGRLFWAHVVIDPIRDPAGELAGFAKITRDVTERKRLEAELVQASKMATLGTLSAGIAHELSQPLNIIRMWSENALMRIHAGNADPARTERALKLIVDQTQRMATIITHVRTFSRADQSAVGDFDPAQSARAAVEFVERPYEVEEIAVEADLPDSVCEIHGNAVQLEQVILNLLSNARDAIRERRQNEPEPAGLISVAMTFDASAGLAKITITDNGAGIPAEAIDRVFDPFFTTKEVGQGTGLGLSVSYSIIDAMGGRLTAMNAQDETGTRGACFSIALPARPVDHASQS
jgi:PAS domain S-box-containing protein